MTYGTTTKTTIEQYLEEKNEETALYLSGTNIIWRLFSTRSAAITLTQSGLTVASPERQSNGMMYELCLKQDSTGGRTVNWGIAFRWDNDVEPEPNLSPGARNIYQFSSHDDGTMYGRLVFKS